MTGDFARGAGYALRGARFVAGRPSLWPLVAAPFVLSLAALVALGWAAVHFRVEVVGALTPGGWIGELVGPVLAALYFLVAAVTGYFLFFPIASIISGPFNETIAERVEELLLGHASAPFSLVRLVRELLQGLAHALRKLLRWLVLAGVVLACTLLVPGVGAIVGFVGGAYVAARFAAFDALDATWSRRGWSFARKEGFLREQRALSLGLGSALAALMLVPVVNALALPFGAAGGALLVHDVTGPDR